MTITRPDDNAPEPRAPGLANVRVRFLDGAVETFWDLTGVDATPAVLSLAGRNSNRHVPMIGNVRWYSISGAASAQVTDGNAYASAQLIAAAQAARQLDEAMDAIDRIAIALGTNPRALDSIGTVSDLGTVLADLATALTEAALRGAPAPVNWILCDDQRGPAHNRPCWIWEPVTAGRRSTAPKIGVFAASPGGAGWKLLGNRRVPQVTWWAEMTDPEPPRD